jgi:hypothetical protein
MHIHLHATVQRRAQGRAAARDTAKSLSETALRGLIDSLEGTVKRLDWRGARTEWGDYYDATNYTDAAFAHKREIVEAALERLSPSNVWDLGANDGTFSRLASSREHSTSPSMSIRWRWKRTTGGRSRARNATSCRCCWI